MLILLILLYGLETWTMLKLDLNPPWTVKHKKVSWSESEIQLHSEKGIGYNNPHLQMWTKKRRTGKLLHCFK